MDESMLSSSLLDRVCVISNEGKMLQKALTPTNAGFALRTTSDSIALDSTGVVLLFCLYKDPFPLRPFLSSVHSVAIIVILVTAPGRAFGTCAAYPSPRLRQHQHRRSTRV